MWTMVLAWALAQSPTVIVIPSARTVAHALDSVSAADSASAPATPASSEPSTLAEWMPSDTVAEVALFGLRGILEDAEDAAGSAPAGIGTASNTVCSVVAHAPRSSWTRTASMRWTASAA